MPMKVRFTRCGTRFVTKGYIGDYAGCNPHRLLGKAVKQEYPEVKSAAQGILEHRQVI